jgi:hypothetical protein
MMEVVFVVACDELVDGWWSKEMKERTKKKRERKRYKYSKRNGWLFICKIVSPWAPGPKTSL